MRKNYNYTRRKLYLPEYGRHIQEMVDSLLEIEDRRERNRHAQKEVAGSSRSPVKNACKKIRFLVK